SFPRKVSNTSDPRPFPAAPPPPISLPNPPRAAARVRALFISGPALHLLQPHIPRSSRFGSRERTGGRRGACCWERGDEEYRPLDLSVSRGQASRPWRDAAGMEAPARAAAAVSGAPVRSRVRAMGVTSPGSPPSSATTRTKMHLRCCLVRRQVWLVEARYVPEAV
uniref:Uncharacterized protein n=1 Tax=Aegilops tauschii subsp. strangulata TaxID=200361 RepID=A0A453QY60_AEGTS